MAENNTSTYTPAELEQLQQLRQSLATFKEMLASLPPELRSQEHNRQYNQLRSETQALLKGPFSEEVPRAITGDMNTDRSLSAVVIGGVTLALIGLGVNSIVLEDVLVNSLGCCVSSGGMLLVVGSLGVMLMKNMRERTSPVNMLTYYTDLLLYEIDHRLSMMSAGSGYPTDIPRTSSFGAGASGASSAAPGRPEAPPVAPAAPPPPEAPPESAPPLETPPESNPDEPPKNL